MKKRRLNEWYKQWQDMFLLVFVALFVFLNGDIMDKKKSILNVSVSIGFKLLTMVMVILVKRLLIKSCGNEVNGLNALYLSIVGFLSVAELGVGSAITFCMYKPIVEEDNDKVSALYSLFQRLYTIIGVIVLVAGLSLAPFLHLLAVDYTALDVNMHLTFVLMLLSVVVTYFFGAQTALINAYKNNYITTAITSGGIMLQYVLQIIVLILTQSFVGYLLCRMVAALAQWIITRVITRRKYDYIVANKQKIDANTRLELTKSIKAMFMHKVGIVLVNTVDSVIISAFVGVIVLGEYSNYTTILTSMTSVIKLVFTSLTSVVGHLCVEKSKETAREYCEAFHMVNFMIGAVFFLGYFAIIDNLIAILFAADLVVERTLSLVITLNGFVQFMRSSVLVFRDATGTFYYDRWKPLVEGAANVVLSIFLVQRIGVSGVIVATIITNLTICHVVEPYILFKKAFLASPGKHYIRNYGMIILFVAMLFLMQWCMRSYCNPWTELLVNGCISVGISAMGCCLILFTNRKLRMQVKKTIKRR